MIGSSCCYMYVTGKTPEPSLHNYTIIVKAYVRYRSNITSHTLKIFVESRARVRQTYFSTSTAHRSGSRSRNIKLRQSIQSSRQVLSRRFICFKVPFLVLTRCLIQHTRGKQLS